MDRFRMTKPQRKVTAITEPRRSVGHRNRHGYHRGDASTRAVASPFGSVARGGAYPYRRHSAFLPAIGRVLTPTLAGALALLAGGCQTRPASSVGVVQACRGAVQVIRVYPWVYSALVRFHGKPIMAWWDNYSVLFAGGRRTATLMAKPGAILHFDGLLTDRDLYFGREWSGPAPPVFRGQAPMIQQAPWPAGVPKPKRASQRPAKTLSPTARENGVDAVSIGRSDAAGPAELEK